VPWACPWLGLAGFLLTSSMYLSAETTAWFHLVRVLIVGVKNFAYPLAG
jgi:hypothetical protein